MSGQPRHHPGTRPVTETIDPADLEWRPGRGSGAHSGAVEACRTPDGRIAVRLVQQPAGPALIFTPSQWAAFAGYGGEFDVGLDIEPN